MPNPPADKAKALASVYVLARLKVLKKKIQVP